MSASSVRELARRHAIGELSQEDYRAQRHALIDEIINGQQALTYNEKRPSRPLNTRLSPRSMAIAGLAISALVIALLGIWIVSAPPQSQTSAHTNAIAVTPKATEMSPGPTLIENFLTANDWSDKGILGFIRQWKSLPPKEQEIARNYYRYPRLIAELRQQIVSQQAMTELAKNKDTTKSQLANLQTMASLLGMSSDD